MAASRQGLQGFPASEQELIFNKDESENVYEIKLDFLGKTIKKKKTETDTDTNMSVI